MADSRKSSFDLEGFMYAAGIGRRRSSANVHPWFGSRSSRSEPRPDYDGERVFDLPLPTVSQRRRGTEAKLARGQIPLADIFGHRRSMVDGELDQELTNEEVFALLKKHNKEQRTVKNGTIRLPSDVLYRRKSRFETDDFDIPAENTADTFDFPELKFTSLAMDNARRRDESDPMKKTYKKLSSFYQETTLLKNTLNRIQGRFGVAIMEFFSFIKWLVMLNFIITVLTLPLILPQLLYSDAPLSDTNADATWNISSVPQGPTHCSDSYTSTVNKNSQHNISEAYFYLLDFVQGTGFLERTLLFHGYYSKKIVIGGVDYPMAQTFLFMTFLSLSISFVWILYSISSHHQRSVVTSGGRTAAAKFSTAVLSGWDYGLMDKSAIKVKRELITQELKQLLAEKEFIVDQKNRTRCETVGLWVGRVVVNLVVLAVWTGCGAAIIFAIQFADGIKEDENGGNEDIFNKAVNLSSQYVPSAVITAIYLLVPTFFNVIVRVERYRPTVELGITMARILFLRLSSLLVLLITTVTKLVCFDDSTCKKRELVCGNPLFMDGESSLNKCWETYIGQQIYRLIILDLAVMVVTTYLLEYPRQALFKKFGKAGLMKLVGQQQFDLPKNVMDVLYNQILCWTGLFFSPFIPAMVTIKMVLYFLIKRGSLFKNQRPSPTLSKSSALYSFFLWVMMLSLLLSYTVLIFYMQTVQPSQSCGPFRDYVGDKYRVFTAIKLVLPTQLSDILKLLGHKFVLAAAIVFLIMLWYLFVTVSNGLQGEIKLYTGQLAQHIGDKQFILSQVNDAIQETNEYLSPKPSTASAPKASVSRNTERSTSRSSVTPSVPSEENIRSTKKTSSSTALSNGSAQDFRQSHHDANFYLGHSSSQYLRRQRPKTTGSDLESEDEHPPIHRSSYGLDRRGQNMTTAEIHRLQEPRHTHPASQQYINRAFVPEPDY